MKTEFIINLIQQLYCSGVSRSQIAFEFGVSVETVRRYSLGQIPAAKQNRFIEYVKREHREVFDYVELQKN